MGFSNLDVQPTTLQLVCHQARDVGVITDEFLQQ
jgi:hypothetical protein